MPCDVLSFVSIGLHFQPFVFDRRLN